MGRALSRWLADGGAIHAARASPPRAPLLRWQFPIASRRSVLEQAFAPEPKLRPCAANRGQRVALGRGPRFERLGVDGPTAQEFPQAGGRFLEGGPRVRTIVAGAIVAGAIVVAGKALGDLPLQLDALVAGQGAQALTCMKS